MPATPSSNLPVRNPRSLGFVSTPRTGVDAALSVPRSGRFHHTASAVYGNATDGLRGFPEGISDVAGMRRSLVGRAPDIPRPPIGRAEGSCCHSPVLFSKLIRISRFSRTPRLAAVDGETDLTTG